MLKLYEVGVEFRDPNLNKVKNLGGLIKQKPVDQGEYLVVAIKSIFSEIGIKVEHKGESAKIINPED